LGGGGVGGVRGQVAFGGKGAGGIWGQRGGWLVGVKQ
jgi:hypothetical protein